MKNRKVLRYWNKRAKEGSGCCVTMPDTYLKQLEIASIYKYIKGNVMLDVGCGNGYTDFKIYKDFDISLRGIDFSEKMINEARKMKTKLYISDSYLNFYVDDVISLNESDNIYDVVLSERCIINLLSWKKQQQAICEIHRVLKPGGIYIMAEAFRYPFDELNKLREIIELPPLKIKSHNRYIKESDLWNFVRNTQFFHIINSDPFSGTYYFLTRIISPKIGEIEDKKTGYFDTINQVATLLPLLGLHKYSISKTYVLEKIK